MFVLRCCDRVAILRMASLGAALLAAPLVASAALAGDNAPPAASAPADQDDGLLKSVLKKANMATDDLGHPQDFVVKSRPATTDYVPVFRNNEEHKTKVLTPDQLKAMEADLDAAGARNAHIRDAFPPARRAYLE